MTDCVNTEVRDALPDLLHGRLGGLDTATMTAHVESCAECRAELALLRELRESAPFALRMDVARIASALPAYGGSASLSALPSRPARANAWRNLVVAASAALVVAIGGLAVANLERTPDDASVPVVASATPALVIAARETTAIANAPVSAPSQQAVKEPTRVSSTERAVASLSLVGGTHDLTESELETLLAELDGMQSIPAAEPQSVTLSVDDLEGRQ